MGILEELDSIRRKLEGTNCPTTYGVVKHVIFSPETWEPIKIISCLGEEAKIENGEYVL